MGVEVRPDFVDHNWYLQGTIHTTINEGQHCVRKKLCRTFLYILYFLGKKRRKKRGKIRWTECALAPTVHDTATMAATMAATGTDDRLETKISSRVQQGQLA